MDFDRKLTFRIILGVTYILIGAALFCLSAAGVYTNEFVSGLSAMFGIIGVVNIIRTVRIKKNSELYDKVKRAETDERNIMIYVKASRLTLVTGIYAAATAIIVLSCMGESTAARIIAWCMCGVCILHYIYVMILRRVS